MRTTVTLDGDVERMLHTAVRERGISFKQALNDAVRVGLTPMRAPRKRRFVQKTYALGSEQHFPWHKALAAADTLEDEELSRRLSVRK